MDVLECVLSQLEWNNTLSDVLTNQGVPDNAAVGMYGRSVVRVHNTFPLSLTLSHSFLSTQIQLVVWGAHFDIFTAFKTHLVVSEIRRLMGGKLRIFHTPLSFGATTLYVPFGISRLSKPRGN